MRAAIYARVSSEDQIEGYSLAAQLRACREHAQAKGWQITGEYVDEGKSAKGADIRKRPEFARLMADVDAQRIDVLIVHKLDRFTRNLRLLLDCFQRLAAANVDLVSLSDKTAYSTPSDRLSIHVLASVAQWFSENLAAETRKGKAERKAQGLYNGWVPYGCVKGADGVPVPDREPLPNGSTNYDGLLLMFRLADEGLGVRPIAAKLNTLGYHTTGNHRGNIWGMSSVNVILRNRFYIGELPGGITAKHGELVPGELFQRVQTALDVRTHQRGAFSVRNDRRTHSLSGLVFCGECGNKLHIRYSHERTRLFCVGRFENPIGCCQKSVALDVLEAEVAAWLSRLRLDPDNIAEAERRQQQPERKDDSERERARLVGQLENLTELRILGDIPLHKYTQRRDALRAELAKLTDHSGRASIPTFAAAWREPLSHWLDLEPPGRQAAARAVFDALVVRDGHIVEYRIKRELLPLLDVFNVPT